MNKMTHAQFLAKAKELGATEENTYWANSFFTHKRYKCTQVKLRRNTLNTKTIVMVVIFNGQYVMFYQQGFTANLYWSTLEDMDELIDLMHRVKQLVELAPYKPEGVGSER